PELQQTKLIVIKTDRLKFLHTARSINKSNRSQNQTSTGDGKPEKDPSRKCEIGCKRLEFMTPASGSGHSIISISSSPLTSPDNDLITQVLSQYPNGLSDWLLE
ncbi:hypothetical protein BY996DRAFT_6559055, partial [Phakopsora pachyrhizi]